MHDYSLFWLGTGGSIKSGGVELFLWAQRTDSLVTNCNNILVDDN
jgi:hypothetical protein